MKNILPVLLFIFALTLSAQESDPVTVVGDSLIGKRIGGESVREVIGNVVITQGNVIITSRRALQNLSRNEIELIGDVVVTQDSITLETERGFYFGNRKVAVSDTNLTLNDGSIILTAKGGRYFVDEEKALFADSVELNDTSTTLQADTLKYYHSADKAVSYGNVKIADTSGYSIYADSLIHFKEKDRSFAYKNIYLKDDENDLVINGNYLEDIGEENYSKITGDALLVQVDSIDSETTDTLIISSQLMESFNDSSRKLIAADSVKIVRGEFASKNSKSIFYRDEERILTLKEEGSKKQPVLWFESSQLVGDTVNIYLEGNTLNKIDIMHNAFILTKIENFNFRFDQISGEHIKMFFEKNKLQKTSVDGNVLSIYYLFEDEAANGLIQSSANNAKIIFTDNEIHDVKLYGQPISEYHPENLIENKEKEFTLPSFILFEGRPEKENLLFEKREKIFTLLSHKNMKDADETKRK